MTQPPEDLVAFYEREYPRLVGALDLYLGDLQTAEDIAQEALLRTMREWRRVRDLDRPGAWTRRVAINLATSRLRRRRSRRRALARLEHDAAVAARDFRDPMAARDEEVRAAVGSLPLPERAAVVLHYFLGHPVVEVAGMVGRPVGTVKSDLHRARRRLRETLRLDVMAEEDADVP